MYDITPEELRALAQRIKNSGVLGRSRTYEDILDYLVECSIEGRAPKEIAIAVDVLDREADFDVARDSIVRVHIYHLRNKLRNYYEEYGQNEPYYLAIPKGQYMLTAVSNHVADQSQKAGVAPRQWQRLLPWLAGAAVVLLLLNLGVQLLTDRTLMADGGQSPGLVNAGPWPTMLDDDTPILILIGDYYIFGETDGHGHVMRMVREFDVNSQRDLRFLKEVDVDGTENYINLDMGYVPTSTPHALARVMTVLLQGGADPDRITVKMASEHVTADLAKNHVVYLGYLSGLGRLRNLMFPASDLRIGGTYDELHNDANGAEYISNSGLAVGESGYRDYGMLSTFPSPNGHQVTMIAGMRDESLMNLAEQVTSEAAMMELEQSVGQASAKAPAYEAIYEVSGFAGTNFMSARVYSGALNADKIERLFSPGVALGNR